MGAWMGDCVYVCVCVCARGGGGGVIFYFWRGGIGGQVATVTYLSDDGAPTMIFDQVFYVVFEPILSIFWNRFRIPLTRYSTVLVTYSIWSMFSVEKGRGRGLWFFVCVCVFVCLFVCVCVCVCIF